MRHIERQQQTLERAPGGSSPASRSQVSTKAGRHAQWRAVDDERCLSEQGASGGLREVRWEKRSDTRGWGDVQSSREHRFPIWTVIKQHRHVIQGGFCWPHGSSQSLSPESLGKLGFLRRNHLQSMFLVTPRVDPGISLPVRKSSAQVSGGSCSLWQNLGWDSGFRPLANMAQGMARAGSLCSEAVSPGACQREEPQPVLCNLTRS